MQPSAVRAKKSRGVALPADKGGEGWCNPDFGPGWPKSCVIGGLGGGGGLGCNRLPLGGGPRLAFRGPTNKAMCWQRELRSKGCDKVRGRLSYRGCLKARRARLRFRVGLKLCFQVSGKAKRRVAVRLGEGQVKGCFKVVLRAA